MKRIAFIILSCLMALSVMAQKEHLKFMGIPLNGNITTFQEKLKAKGISYNRTASAKTKAGVRCFDGIFSGEKARIYVYYNEKTKIVYRAKAVIEFSNKDIGEQRFEKFKSMLKEKYLTAYAKDSEQDGYPSMGMLVYDSEFDKSLGIISLYMTDTGYSFMDEVYLHVDYEDDANTSSDMDKNMDDL